MRDKNMKKVVIMGCGRTGSWLANLLDAAGHSVTVMDVDAYSFRRLSPDFKGKALVSNGIEEEALKKAGIEEAEVFIAVTQGDNRNIMAAQMAKHIFNVPRVICRIYDPLRQEIYQTLGLETISPTTIFAEMLKKWVEG
jgi:trk system potassium uptake protein